MSELKEYIVTLNDKQDLDAFYDDMETPGGTLYIPDRAVDLVNRRPISRNTHYMLTDEEAEQIRNDPRVMAVEVHIRYTDVKVMPAVSRTSNEWSKEHFDRSSAFTWTATNFTNDKNWALLRCVNGQQISNWGDNDSAVDLTSITRPSTTTDVFSQTSTVTTNETGKNIDVVIVDGLIDPNHPEFAVNIDGTGGSRVVQYNWFQHNPTVTGGAVGTYDYTINEDPLKTGINSNNNHGTHVAGTAAGNSQGWAVDANIYNIYAYGSVNGMPDTTYTMFDYIRAFHNNKSINPETGRKNPTITNNSYGFYSTRLQPTNQITSITYRGTTIQGPFTDTDITTLYGLRPYGLVAFSSGGNAALDADIADAITDGIIVVAAAGNFNEKIDVVGGIDYNNSFVWTLISTITGQPINVPYYYHRGSTPGATPGVITVGSIDALSIEYQAYYSNNGPGVDVYAPGTNIVSSIDTKYGFHFSYLGMSGTGRTNIVSGTDSTTSPSRFKVTKSTLGVSAWDTGAFSISDFVGGMGLAFNMYQTNAAMAIGFKSYISLGLRGSNIALANLPYAFYIKADGTYQFIESGTITGTSTAYTTSSTFEIWYYNSTVRYVVDGTIVRTVSGLSSSLHMYVDSVMYTPGGSVGYYALSPIVTDPRNGNYFLDKINGTSMASPQVTGVLACVLQTYPNFTQANCLNYITTYAKAGQLTDVPNNDWTKRYNLHGAPNKYLYFYKERVDDGNVYPKKNFLPRSTSGVTYPRPKIRR